LPHGVIAAIEYYLPEQVLTTEDLSAQHPEWTVEKVDRKTGIHTRHIAGPDQCSSDLAVAAAEKLFATGACKPEEIDYVLLCTQTPDYFIPTTACLIQNRLGIPIHAGAIDFNQACSGYIFGLGLAEGLIASCQASNVLLLTAETYTKLLHPQDRSVRTIFGDGAAATLIRAEDITTPSFGPFIYGTDGRGGPNLMVPAGGMRQPRTAETATPVEDENGNIRSQENLFMAGAEVFNLTIQLVPRVVAQVLSKSSLRMDEVDLFVFHQANQYILEHARKRLGIAPENFVISVADCGNTVSSTIPIALKSALQDGRLQKGKLVLLAGYGAGYSWGGVLVRW
jgi:3-oxoacyl-[acyl-carrier-protein] synthase-3